MAMLKGLRKHNKWILVVGGSLLMIAWLMPQGINRLGPGAAGPVQGTVDGRKVRLVELSRYTNELQAVQLLIPTIVENLLESAGRSRADAAHWMLLSQEAEEAGYVGGPQDGADWLQDIAPELAYRDMLEQAKAQMPQINEQLFRQYILPSKQQELQQRTEQVREFFSGPGLQRAAGEGRLTLDDVNKAVSKARGIYRMRVAYLSAPRASYPAALLKGKELGDNASADVVFIPSDLLLAGIPDPTEEELAAHVETYRDTIPNTGQFGVGYRQPPRIKFEYMKFDRAAIRQAVVLDPVATYKEWQLNRDKFKGEFAEEKAKVEEQIRDRRADDVTQAAVQVVRAEVFKSIKRLDQEGTYRKVPPDWDAARPRLEVVAQAVQAQVSDTTGVKIPLPTVVVKAAKWQNLSDLAADQDLAGASIHYASREYPLAGDQGQPPVMFQLRELGIETPLNLQTGIPLVEYPAEDAARNTYFFTVLDARKESPPESIDEVRDAAVADFKKIKAYDTLATKLDEYRRLAVTGGPAAVVDSFRQPEPAGETPKLPTVVNGVTVSRLRVDSGRQLNTEAFRTSVMAAADKIDPLTDPVAYDPDGATVAVPIPEHLGIAVAKITRVHPLTWEDYRQGIEGALSQDTRRQVETAATISPFSFQAAAARHGWVQRVSDDEEEEAAPNGPAQTDDKAADKTDDKTDNKAPPAKG